MRQTRFLTLFGVVLLVGVTALAATDLLVRSGRAVLIAPASLVFTLPAIAILLAAFAWPLVRYRRELASALIKQESKPVKRVDPFYAVRVLILAKASAFTSAVILGWQLGILLYLLNLPAQSSDSVTRTIEAIVAAVILLIVALVVERFCKLPSETKGLGLDKAAAAENPGATA